MNYFERQKSFLRRLSEYQVGIAKYPKIDPDNMKDFSLICYVIEKEEKGDLTIFMIGLDPHKTEGGVYKIDLMLGCGNPNCIFFSKDSWEEPYQKLLDDCEKLNRDILENYGVLYNCVCEFFFMTSVRLRQCCNYYQMKSFQEKYIAKDIAKYLERINNGTYLPFLIEEAASLKEKIEQVESMTGTSIEDFFLQESEAKSLASSIIMSQNGSENHEDYEPLAVMAQEISSLKEECLTVKEEISEDNKHSSQLSTLLDDKDDEIEEKVNRKCKNIITCVHEVPWPKGKYSPELLKSAAEYFKINLPCCPNSCRIVTFCAINVKHRLNALVKVLDSKCFMYIPKTKEFYILDADTSDEEDNTSTLQDKTSPPSADSPTSNAQNDLTMAPDTPTAPSISPSRTPPTTPQTPLNRTPTVQNLHSKGSLKPPFPARPLPEATQNPPICAICKISFTQLRLPLCDVIISATYLNKVPTPLSGRPVDIFGVPEEDNIAVCRSCFLDFKQEIADISKANPMYNTIKYIIPEDSLTIHTRSCEYKLEKPKRRRSKNLVKPKKGTEEEEEPNFCGKEIVKIYDNPKP